MRTKEQYEHPSVYVDELLLERHIMESSQGEDFLLFYNESFGYGEKEGEWN